jgi:hypothetical protein
LVTEVYSFLVLPVGMEQEIQPLGVGKEERKELDVGMKYQV